MKKIFTLIAVMVLSCAGVFAQGTSDVTGKTRYMTMKDGQVIAIPEKYILAEKEESGVIVLTLEGGKTFTYSASNVESQSDSYDVTGYKLNSFAFTHDDNDQVYADVEATIKEEGDTVYVSANVPVIGKRLRPAFTVGEGTTMWVGAEQQVSGQSSQRYTTPVVYTIAEPEHWIYSVTEIKTEEPEKPAEPDVQEGWVDTKLDISKYTTTNAPSNYSDDLYNVWDDSDATYYHSTWGDGYYQKLSWVNGGYYGDGITEWPYIEIQLAEALDVFCLSYTTSTQDNRFPQGWRITALNGSTGKWDEIDLLSAEEDGLPQKSLEKFVTPRYELGAKYMAIRLELTKASYKNYLVIGDLSLYSCKYVQPADKDNGDEEPEVSADPNRVGDFVPFGRPCKVSVNYLTDNATGDYKIPTVYITFGDGVSWNSSQWIGQTLYDEQGNQYNTKEEWIKDCTFRLDGAGIWPDIETVEGCEVRGRGNSSWSWSYMSKNPYRIKFPKKQKQAPFNLTEDRQWVFIANKQNGSMITNSIAQKVAAMVDGEALCHMIPIDLYINGHYRGSYCFTEKIGIADNSVAIDEATGCLLELDDYYDEDFRFRDNTYYLPVNVKDPDFGEEDEERVVTFDAVQQSVNDMTNTLYWNGDITQHIDMESWAKFWLVNDLVRNVETYHPKSCYLFNEDVVGGAKWKFGPAWDFDWAFGYEETYSYFYSGATEDLYSKRSGKAGYNFYNDLRNTVAGKRAYYKEWLDFVAEGRIDELTEYIADYTDFALLSIEHNNDANVSEKNSTDYVAQIERSQQWMRDRAEFIMNGLTKYDDISSGYEIPEDFGKPLEALLIVDALHQDFAPEFEEYASVSYVRGMTEGVYGTVVLPFAPDAESLENYAFYALSEAGDGYIRFEEVAEPVANMPYLYTLREGKENTPITGGYTVISTTAGKSSVDGWETIGSFFNKTLRTGNNKYYMFSAEDGNLAKVADRTEVLPYRAYFRNNSAVDETLCVYIGDEACSIKVPGEDIEGFGTEHIYDVYGRRVLESVKGKIYIVNGKKVIF